MSTFPALATIPTERDHTMADHSREYNRLERELNKQGIETTNLSAGGFRARIPGTDTIVSFRDTTDPKSLKQQRTAIIRAGFQWPLDPKPRAPRAPRVKAPAEPIPAGQVETETTMPTPKNMEIVAVTPEIAEKWLDKNITNRKLSDLVVAKYTRMMRDGQWHYDGSPIRFDKNGKLIDGQHRLWAIIESGTTQEFLVLHNLDPKSFITIDTGKVRSFGDVLSIEYPNMKSVHNIAAVTGIVWRWEQGHRGKNLRPTGNIPAAPPEVLLEFFKPLHDEIISIQRGASKLGQKMRGFGTSTAALLMWVLGNIDADDADFFFDRFADGVGLEEGSPILALRNTVMKFQQNNMDNRRTMPAELGVALGIKAWNAYRRGDDVKQLTYRVGGAKPEPFPEPI
jgi:hypothetical protein